MAFVPLQRQRFQQLQYDTICATIAAPCCFRLRADAQLTEASSAVLQALLVGDTV
jgi:hypothetical protein